MPQSVPSPHRQYVIAVHGFASTGKQWSRLADVLSDDFDVFTPDLPGYGKLRNLKSFGRPTLYGDAIKIAGIVFQAPAPVHLVAHSYGAAVALKYAIENPHAVASLTLIEPALFHLLRNGNSEEMAHYTEISAVANAVRLSCLNGTPKTGMSRFVDYWNGAGSWEALNPAIQASLASQTLQVACNFAASFAETWPAETCRRLKIPALLVAGENSPALARRVTEILANALPNTRQKLIAGAGHMAPITHPNEVNSLIKEALSDAHPLIDAADIQKAA